MGRYAFFNTGIEYKFAFALQPSEDILKFGGTPTFAYEGDHEIKWSIVDRKRIIDTIRDLEERLGFPTLSFDAFEKSNKGNSELRQVIDNEIALVNASKLAYTYLLGCVIYHQLLYKLDLSCTYEP